MNINIDLPKDVVVRIRQAVERGDYESPQDFVERALRNQLEHDETPDTEAMTLEEAFAAVDTEASVPRPEPEPPSDAVNSRQEIEIQPAEATEVHLTLLETDKAVPTVPAPDRSRLEDGPLWGQYNRIFPVKIVVRALRNSVSDAPAGSDEKAGWIPHSSFGESVAETARILGMKIAQYDKRSGRGRGEKLSTGLPVGDDPSRSKERFVSHFVGETERDDNLTGAAPQLQFVNIQKTGTGIDIGLTKMGWEFAALENPLLDGGAGAQTALSADERAFFLAHVREHYTEEYDAMATVVKAIHDGDDRPDSLTNRVAYLNTEWSASHARTIRSGLTGRMYELGLLDRYRVGQRGVGYELTDEGASFLDEVTAGDYNN
jgi:Arc/MetJ-type ribon-helix-helix transcriptional regulator